MVRNMVERAKGPSRVQPRPWLTAGVLRRARSADGCQGSATGRADLQPVGAYWTYSSCTGTGPPETLIKSQGARFKWSP